MKTAVHITHEAVQKLGGIGSVISGFSTTAEYRCFFDRTLLYGPLFSNAAYGASSVSLADEDPLTHIERLDGGKLLRDIERKYGVEILYGRRLVRDDLDLGTSLTADVLLVGTESMRRGPLDRLKARLKNQYGLDCDRYYDWEFHHYLRLAVVYPELLFGLYPDETLFYHFAHEFMGVPSVLSVLLRREGAHRDRTIFYAHEISPCRIEVESHPGHDIAFYNTLRANRRASTTFEDEYGSRDHHYRAALVKLSRHFDHIFAVSDRVKEEYIYFVGDAAADKIKVVINGVPVRRIAAAEKEQSRRILLRYAENLLDFTPDFLFSHVSRLVVSKAIWRDLAFLSLLDDRLAASGRTGIYLLFSSLIGPGRTTDQILQMEKAYGWPLDHREGWPDLIASEAALYDQVCRFNARCRSIRAVYLNQFGLNREACGLRMPEEMCFLHLRMGSDAELGFSIYEPFGISQLEVIPFGGLAAISTSCGAADALRRRLPEGEGNAYLSFDFIGSVSETWSVDAIRSMTAKQRIEIETEVFRREADRFYRALPDSSEQRERALSSALEHADRLGWEGIVRSVGLEEL